MQWIGCMRPSVAAPLLLVLSACGETPPPCSSSGPLESAPSAGCLIWDQRGALLVKSWSDEWALPGGSVAAGESARCGAEREVFEETGFEVKIVNTKPMAESRYEIERNGELLQKTVWFYEMEVVEPFKNEPDDEIEEIALVDFDGALNLLTHEEDRKILKYVFNQ